MRLSNQSNLKSQQDFDSTLTLFPIKDYIRNGFKPLIQDALICENVWYFYAAK